MALREGRSTYCQLDTYEEILWKFKPKYNYYHSRKCIWKCLTCRVQCVNTLRLRRNGQHLANIIFKRIFFSENVWIGIKISLKFVPKGPINNILALVQIMAWRCPVTSHCMNQWWLVYQRIYVTRPQRVNKPHSNLVSNVQQCWLEVSYTEHLQKCQGKISHCQKAQGK